MQLGQSKQGTPETQGQGEAMEARGGQGSPSPRDTPSRGAGKATSTLKPSSQV